MWTPMTPFEESLAATRANPAPPGAFEPASGTYCKLIPVESTPPLRHFKWRPIMLGVIVYLVCCAGIAMVLTLLYAMLRPVKNRDELRSWRVLLIMYIFTLAAPYGYSEILTRIVGNNMDEAVTRAIDDANIQATLSYYRVLTYNGKDARVVVVAKAKADWGGTDKPVLALSMSKQPNNSWKVESYRVIASDKLNQDGFTFPPYY